MPKRMIWFGNGEAASWRMLDLRQGLDPLPRLDLLPAYAYSTTMSLALSPDQGVLTHTTTPGVTTSVYKDPANLGSRMNTSASFSGQVYCCGASDEFYAFGGVSPSLLMVFRSSDDSLVLVNTTGLGSVNSIAFSLDGALMAVSHTTSPHARIYKTSDWSFINVGTASGSSNQCIFSADSSKLLVLSNSPYLSVYETTTGVRSYSNTSTPAVTSFGYMNPGRHPNNPDVVIHHMSQSPFIGTFDFSTNTRSSFTAASPVLTTGYGVLVDPDPEEDTVYLFHANAQNRNVTRFRISTGVATEQPAVLRNLLSHAQPGAVIVTTTPHRIRGTVRDVNNNPAARVVRAYKRDTGELMAQTTSDPVTGDYTLKVYDAGPYDVQFMTEPGESLNDLFFSKSEPEPL